MTATTDALDVLRGEIDKLDDSMHDLLMHRAEVVQQIAAIKRDNGGQTVIRPGREATILRRLLARHKGSLPPVVVARIWRELIAALCRMQGPLQVAVHAPERQVPYWDLARRYYGSSTPTTLHGSAHHVLRAAAEGAGTLGVLPLPQDGEADPWWPHLAAGGSTGPRIIARLPFVADPGAPDEVAALVVAAIDPEPSGADVSLLAVSFAEAISRARLNELLRQSGLPAQCIASHGGGPSGAPELQLVEVADFIDPGDPRLERFEELARQPLHRVVALGAYAVPIPAQPV